VEVKDVMIPPLDGIRVVENASFVSGPYAGMLLADLGATVIKVERPGTGDPLREAPAWSDDSPPPFAAYNRNKSSVTIDLKKDGGRAVYERLVGGCDVVIENFRPGTLDRLGVGYEGFRERYPALVYCSITGQGATGPHSHHPTYDAIAMARSGLWSLLTDLRNPKAIGPVFSDQLAGLFGAMGVCAALLARQQTGRGQRVALSLLTATMAFIPDPIAHLSMLGKVDDLSSRARRSQSHAFVSSDGLPLTVHLSSLDKFWHRLTVAIGHPELEGDARFATHVDRVQNYDAMHAVLSRVFSTRSRREWLEALDMNDVPAAPIHDIAEALADADENDQSVLRSYGNTEQTRLAGLPFRFEGDDSVRPACPHVGEHTDSVLAGLGYSKREIRRLRSEHAV